MIVSEYMKIWKGAVMIDEYSAQLFKLQAGICKTLADSTRLMILNELKRGEMSVGQLTMNLGLPQSNVSRHLAVLRERAVVTPRRDGTTVYYSLANPKIAEACELVREVLEGQLIQNQRLASSLKSLMKA
jgi:DNA-binding transcriptional ArsR family regulator